MKVRTSLVSNSSTSSFILQKKDLSEEKIRGFSSWLNLHNLTSKNYPVV